MKPLYLAKSLPELEKRIYPSKRDSLGNTETSIIRLYEDVKTLKGSDEEKAFISCAQLLHIFDMITARGPNNLSREMKSCYETAKFWYKELRGQLETRYKTEEKISYFCDLPVCDDPFPSELSQSEPNRLPGRWIPPAYLYDMIVKKENVFIIDVRLAEEYSLKKIKEIPQVNLTTHLYHGLSITALVKRMTPLQQKQWLSQKKADLNVIMDKNYGSTLIINPHLAESHSPPTRHPLKIIFDILVTYNADKASHSSVAFLAGGFEGFEKRYPSCIYVDPTQRSSVVSKPSEIIGYPRNLDASDASISTEIPCSEIEKVEHDNSKSVGEVLSYSELSKRIGVKSSPQAGKNERLHKPTVDRSLKPQNTVSPFPLYPSLRGNEGMKEISTTPISTIPQVNRSTKPRTAAPTNNTVLRPEPDLSKIPIPLRRGLVNIGNTCYMNSALQCLLHTPMLWQFFTTQKPFPSDLSILFAKLFREMSNPHETSAYSPTDFKKVFGKLHPAFSGDDQQDSHEFLIILLDSLHEGLNKAKNSAEPNKSEITSGDYQWMFNRNHDDSVILDCFNGQLRSTVSCHYCNRRSYAFDEFMYLSVSIKVSVSTNLTECIKDFFKEEILSNGSYWLCPQCQTPREASKLFHILRFPKYLIIHLKRFQSCDACEKIETNVYFPLTGLSLMEFAEKRTPDCSYDLYGVINHHGSVTSGHYTAFCFDWADRSWRKLNDSRVTEMSKSELSNADAYILFYKQSSVQGTY